MTVVTTKETDEKHVISVVLTGEITSYGMLRATCVVTAKDLLGRSGVATRCFDGLVVNLSEVLPGMGIANARFGDQDTCLTILGIPTNAKKPHEKFPDLLLDSYGTYKFRVGNLELTWIIDELEGLVPEHGHPKNVVGEWQIHIGDARQAVTFCKNGFTHGHPDGWGNRMVAVKLIAEAVED